MLANSWCLLRCVALNEKIKVALCRSVEVQLHMAMLATDPATVLAQDRKCVRSFMAGLPLGGGGAMEAG